MSSSTADALGLSRAILCNDTLVKKLQELQDTELMYRGLVEHSRKVLKVKKNKKIIHWNNNNCVKSIYYNWVIMLESFIEYTYMINF